MPPTLRKIMCRLVVSSLPWISILAVGLASVAVQAQETGEIDREKAIKAAYLYNFGRYVQWPAESTARAQSPFVTGVLEADPIVEVLEEVAKRKKIHGRPIVIKHFASIAKYTPCQILFIASTVDPAERKAAIHKFQKSAVLLVGEDPGFARQGGMVNFSVNDNRIHIEINLDISKEAGLEISSKLLSLAKVVATR